MPRTTWATDEQEEWLKSHKAAFLDAHQKKTLSKEFFPVIVKEFRDKWPPAEPTAEEVADASSFEEANKRKRTKYDKVKLLLLLQDNWLRYMCC
jgi:predicted metal-dependent hydrolase